MAYRINYIKHQLQFKFKAGTSRGVLTEKEVYYIIVHKEDAPTVKGVGECAPLVKLSIDDRPDFEMHLGLFCQKAMKISGASELYSLTGIRAFPSILTGLEMAFQDLKNRGKRIVYDEDFVQKGTRIPINGLVWMGDKDFMFEQIKAKLDAGFDCIKMKIGAINFEEECELLRYIRAQFSAEQITLRVDANGAFSPQNALEKLKILSDFDMHSIEQPIKQGQWDDMAELCRVTPLAIALDEELIGVVEVSEKKRLLQHIQPQYIILKPTLIGGFQSSDEWINLAKQQQLDWWMTSALESNVGLNAIAQFTAKHQVTLPQGLGTGQLFRNNIDSPLSIEKGHIFYDQAKDWDNSSWS